MSHVMDKSIFEIWLWENPGQEDCWSSQTPEERKNETNPITASISREKNIREQVKKQKREQAQVRRSQKK